MRDSDRQAREFHGLVRLLEDLGSATENVFARLYRSLTRRSRVVVDADSLSNYREQAELILQRARRQTIEISRLTGILGTIEEGVIMQNPEGRITLMNDAAKNLVGSSKSFWQSDLGRMFRMAHGLSPVERQMQLVGKPQRVAINNLILAVKLAAINNARGEHLGTVMLLSDATDDSLADRLKDSFITQMSHELRTPLTAIKGMSDVLLNLPEGKPPKRSFLEAISRNVAVLDRMVVELLDISELSSGSFDVRQDTLQLDDLLFTIMKGFEPRIVQSELHAASMITNHRALKVLGDNRRLQWAIGHIVDNAVNYTLPGGEITVQIGKIRDNRVLLEVEDTGVGIQTRDLPRIFERFYRGEAKTIEGKLIDPRGLGQGLFIAQRVLEAHGGYVGVASVPGQGSTFTLALPIAS